MRLQPKNLNKVRVINLCYIKILLQVVFQIWFLYPALYWLGNNTHARVDSIQSCLGWFDSTGNQFTVDYYSNYWPAPVPYPYPTSYIWWRHRLHVLPKSTENLNPDEGEAQSLLLPPPTPTPPHTQNIQRVYKSSHKREEVFLWGNRHPDIGKFLPILDVGCIMIKYSDAKANKMASIGPGF